MAITIRTEKQAARLRKLSVLDGVKVYTKLRQDVTKAGILERDYRYYTLIIFFSFAGFATSVFMVFTTTSYPLLFLWLLVLSFFTVQLAGLLHDSGHRAIFTSTRNNDLMGILSATAIGMIHEEWRVKHNRHHANPNVEGVDTDIDIPLLSFTKERFASKSGLAKMLAPYQVFFYYPIGILLAFSLRYNGIEYYIKYFSLKNALLMVLFAISLFLWFVMPFFVFSLPKALFVEFVSLSFTGFYAWNIFAPNHKGHPYLEKGIKFSFLEHQIMTARNVNGHFLTDLFYMGLNYQIEHHLFPNCPRNKLKLISPYVKKLSRQLKLDYESVSVLGAARIILKELSSVAEIGKRPLPAKAR